MGALREMSSPIMFPPVATSHRAPDLSPKRRSFADRAHAQNLDAAPPLPMHFVGMHVMTPSVKLPNFSALAGNSRSFRRNFIVFIFMIQVPAVPALSLAVSKRGRPNSATPARPSLLMMILGVSLSLSIIHNSYTALPL
jgi:hypothetical protein